MTDIEVPRTKVEVTQEDIDKGIPEDCNHCAVALALKRKYKTDDAEVRLHGVDSTPVLIVDGKELNIRSNHENDILDFIDVFDKQYNYTTTEEYYDRQKPKPFEFEVNLI